MKKIIKAALLLSAVFLLSGCGGGRKVEDETITSYLDEVYLLERNLELTELTDVAETASESKNEVTVTCTTAANNKYGAETANWTLNFEKLNDQWIGTNYKKGVSEFEIYDLPQDEFAEIAFKDYYSYIYFNIDEYNLDKENGSIEASCTAYKNAGSYYTQWEMTQLAHFNRDKMRWESNGSRDATDEILGGIKVDLSTHYENNNYSDAVRFDIEQDPNDPSKFVLKNFKYRYRKYSVIEEKTPTDGENVVMDFQYVTRTSMFGDHKMVIATIPCETTEWLGQSDVIRFYLYSDMLAYGIGYSREEDVLELTPAPRLPVTAQYQGQAKQ